MYWCVCVCLALSDLGFRYDWVSMFKITEVMTGGPAHQILEVGDRLLQVFIHLLLFTRAHALFYLT